MIEIVNNSGRWTINTKHIVFVEESFNGSIYIRLIDGSNIEIQRREFAETEVNICNFGDLPILDTDTRCYELLKLVLMAVT